MDSFSFPPVIYCLLKLMLLFCLYFRHSQVVQERAVFAPMNICKACVALMYLSTWWLYNEVAGEVLYILHTLLDFNSTEAISHCPLGWVFAILSAEAPDLECAHSTKKVFPSLQSDGVQVGLQHFLPPANWPLDHSLY